MGFFSWITQDTKRSIPSCYTDKPRFTVFMTDNLGNKWKESNYEGYGVFGGKDYYELTAEMNADVLKEAGFAVDRDGYFDLVFSTRADGVPDLIYPSLSENGEWNNGHEPERCPHQGFFYPAEQKRS